MGPGQPGSGVVIDWVTERSSSSASKAGRRLDVANRLAKLDSLSSDGVFLGYKRPAALFCHPGGTSASLCTETKSWLKGKRELGVGQERASSQKKVRGIMGPEGKDKKNAQRFWEGLLCGVKRTPRYVQTRPIPMADSKGITAEGLKVADEETTKLIREVFNLIIKQKHRDSQFIEKSYGYGDLQEGDPTKPENYRSVLSHSFTSFSPP